MKKVTLLMSGIMVMSCAPQQKKLVYKIIRDKQVNFIKKMIENEI